MNKEIERLLKDVLAAYSKVLSWHPPEGAEKRYPFSQFGSNIDLEIETFKTLYTAPKVDAYLVKT
jgi:hypothetical protein